MFNILCLSIEDALARLNTLQDQIDQKDVPWRRNAAAYFITVFATVREFEMALDATVCELESIAIDSEAPTKVILRKKITNLQCCTDAFGEALIRVYSLRHLELNHNEKMLLPQHNPKSFWRDQPTVVNLYALSCPSILLENERATYFVEYPLEGPDALALRNVFNAILQGNSEWSRIEDQVLRHMRERMQFETVDVRNHDVLRSAIADVREGMAQIEQSRQVFAQLIKHYFPLNIILT